MGVLETLAPYILAFGIFFGLAIVAQLAWESWQRRFATDPKIEKKKRQERTARNLKESKKASWHIKLFFALWLVWMISCGTPGMNPYILSPLPFVSNAWGIYDLNLMGLVAFSGAAALIMTVALWWTGKKVKP